MAKTKEPSNPGGHRAIYSTDKRDGGYLVKVNGPSANKFAGRTVPVETKAGTIHQEELERLVWSGVSDGSIDGYAGPTALYKFKAKPKEEAEEIPF